MTDFDVLAITTAYEQGVGKGHDAYRRGTVIENPYAPGQCFKAWAIGFEEGSTQAARSLPDSQLRAMILEECRYTSDGNIEDAMALGRRVEAYCKGCT